MAWKHDLVLWIWICDLEWCVKVWAILTVSTKVDYLLMVLQYATWWRAIAHGCSWQLVGPLFWDQSLSRCCPQKVTRKCQWSLWKETENQSRISTNQSINELREIHSQGRGWCVWAHLKLPLIECMVYSDWAVYMTHCGGSCCPWCWKLFPHSPLLPSSTSLTGEFSQTARQITSQPAS